MQIKKKKIYEVEIHQNAKMIDFFLQVVMNDNLKDDIE